MRVKPFLDVLTYLCRNFHDGTFEVDTIDTGIPPVVWAGISAGNVPADSPSMALIKVEANSGSHHLSALSDDLRSFDTKFSKIAAVLHVQPQLAAMNMISTPRDYGDEYTRTSRSRDVAFLSELFHGSWMVQVPRTMVNTMNAEVNFFGGYQGENVRFTRQRYHINIVRYTLSGRHPVRGETRVAVEIRGGSEFIRSSTVQLAKTAADKLRGAIHHKLSPFVPPSKRKASSVASVQISTLESSMSSLTPMSFLDARVMARNVVGFGVRSSTARCTASTCALTLTSTKHADAIVVMDIPDDSHRKYPQDAGALVHLKEDAVLVLDILDDGHRKPPKQTNAVVHLKADTVVTRHTLDDGHHKLPKDADLLRRLDAHPVNTVDTLDDGHRERPKDAEMISQLDAYPVFIVEILDDGHHKPPPWPWLWILPIGALSVCLLGCVYAATAPMQYGGSIDETKPENMSYWRRLLAVTTLSLAGGGASLVFLGTLGYLLYLTWLCSNSWWGYIRISCIAAMLFTWLTPLRPPKSTSCRERLRNPIFRLWREYFGFEFLVEDSRLLRREVERKGSTFLVGQLPHAVVPIGAVLGNSIMDHAFPGIWPMTGVVASMLLKTPVMRNLVNWLGVREAGKKTIVDLFTKGCKGVGVVTGGIGEMFVSQMVEKIVAPRAGFAKIAIQVNSTLGMNHLPLCPHFEFAERLVKFSPSVIPQSGHTIVLAFVYGVSRTHVLLPGLDDDRIRSTSRKWRLPLVLFHGAFGFVPYREKLKMVVSRPILVTQNDNPSPRDIEELQLRIRRELCRLYTTHKPKWETRDIQIMPKVEDATANGTGRYGNVNPCICPAGTASDDTSVVPAVDQVEGGGNKDDGFACNDRNPGKAGKGNDTKNNTSGTCSGNACDSDRNRTRDGGGCNGRNSCSVGDGEDSDENEDGFNDLKDDDGEGGNSDGSTVGGVEGQEERRSSIGG